MAQEGLSQRRPPESLFKRRVRKVASSIVGGADYDTFLQAQGLPPSCSERRSWWIGAFEKKFGPEAAAKLKESVFNWQPP